MAALTYLDGARGVRSPYDPVPMFKILVIHVQHGLSDDRAEFLINDRLFRRFDDAVPAAGYIAMSGQIVDSSLVAAPKQRHTRAEKQAVKAGKNGLGDLDGSAGAGGPGRCPVDDPDRPQAARRRAFGAGANRNPDLRLQGTHQR